MAIRNSIELQRMLQESNISMYDPIEIPPALISFDKTPVATTGNFSAVIGKPKSRKSYFLSYLIAQAFTKHAGKIQVNQPQHGIGVGIFDTEQSSHKTQKNVNIIAKMVGGDPENINLVSYNLRKYNSKTRTELIEQYLIDNAGDVQLMIIDGIRDLVTSINDEQEASTIVGKLMYWSQEYNLHIVVVLHQNKADGNARGHLGTEVINKAETIIEVEKIDEHISTVKCVFSRDEHFPPFSFEILPEGTVGLIDTPISKKHAKNKNKPTEQDSFLPILKHIFSEQPRLNYGDLVSALQKECTKNELHLGVKKIKEMVGISVGAGLLLKKKGVKNTTVYQLTT